MIPPIIPSSPWPAGRKILFRFFFVYLMLQVAPWTWLDAIPGISSITQYYYEGLDWALNMANQYLFHVRPVLVQPNGSGDTSWGWTQVWLYLSLSFLACVVWSILDRKRKSYNTADYWLRTFVRYFIAMTALSYGILKVFAMQMYFPNLSQLATPLGDLLPMRLSWLFIGYSTPYQVFSGVMETMAGILLLNRRTVTMGLLMSVGVFANVVMLNLSYDIPVKIFSMHLLFYSVYLLAYDWKRLASFFLGNQPVTGTALYDLVLPEKWMRITRVIAKIVFVALFVVYQFYNYWNYYQSSVNVAELKPIRPGLYDVKTFVLNGDTIPALVTDTLRWKDVVFEKGGQGSVNTTDTLFRQRYRRGYFNYKPDTATNTMSIVRRSVINAETPLFTVKYELPDVNTMKLWAKIRNDSLYVELVKSKRHFQLTERQFHWLSEYNR